MSKTVDELFERISSLLMEGTIIAAIFAYIAVVTDMVGVAISAQQAGYLLVPVGSVIPMMILYVLVGVATCYVLIR